MDGVFALQIKLRKIFSAETGEGVRKIVIVGLKIGSIWVSQFHSYLKRGSSGEVKKSVMVDYNELVDINDFDDIVSLAMFNNNLSYTYFFFFLALHTQAPYPGVLLGYYFADSLIIKIGLIRQKTHSWTEFPHIRVVQSWADLISPGARGKKHTQKLPKQEI